MTNEFIREERYFVFKISDVVEHLTTAEALHLARLYEIQRVGRKEAGKAELECVVVESDWPEYEPTWQAIEARVTGAQPAPVVKDERVTFREWFEGEQGVEYDGLWSFAKAAWFARAALGAPSVPNGWKLVPIEPTTDMICEMERQWMCGSQIDMAKREWKAACAAAPNGRSEYPEVKPWRVGASSSPLGGPQRAAGSTPDNPTEDSGERVVGRRVVGG